MLCVLVNHSHINEVQTITQIFFPHSHIDFAHDVEALNASSGYAVVSRMSVNTDATGLSANDGSVCTGEVYCDGVLQSACTMPPVGGEIIPGYPLNMACLNEKRLLMLALFHALKKVLPVQTPWGALTGIRPSKLVRQWLTDGWDENHIIQTLVGTFACAEHKARLALTVARAEEALTRRIYAAARTAPDAALKAPLGLYIGIPYCPTRCLYCSFSACTKPADEDTQARYIQALTIECRRVAASIAEKNGVLTSVYIGGGTPTSLSEKHFDLLLERLADCFAPLCRNTEYTVEAGRPDSITPVKLNSMKSHGVTRIAVNPQTLNDHTLTRIGRAHTAGDFYRAFADARKAGFGCINTDVIVGLPGEGPEDMRRTMEGLTALSPENITVHTLAVKRASRLNEYLPDYALTIAPVIEEMLDIAAKACDNIGLMPYYLYRQKSAVGTARASDTTMPVHASGLYENIGYSLPGHECLYNIGMMAETQTILAAGAGAVNKYVNGTRIDRVFNVKNADIYMDKLLKGTTTV